MFLLPSIAAGFALAVILGGRPARMLDLRLRRSSAVIASIAIQLVLYSRLGHGIPQGLSDAAHIASYVLLAWFGVVNRRAVALTPVTVGMLLNGVAILANGGRMPVLTSAARAAGLSPADYANVSVDATNLWFLGDVFALPSRLPFANTFSIGDVLIGVGMAAFIVHTSCADDGVRRDARRTRLAPLRLSSYRYLVGGKLVSSIGDWLTLAALVGWIYESTHSTATVAAVLVARLGSPIIGASAASYIVDRFWKRRLLVTVELGRAAVMLVGLGGVLLHSIAAVVIALTLSGALAAVSSATLPALIPSLVPSEDLPMANAGLGIARNSAMAIGAGGAGLALSSFGAPIAVALDLLTFVLAALLYQRLSLPNELALRPGSRQRSVYRYLMARPRLACLLSGFAAATFATGLMTTTLPRFFEGELNVGPQGYAFGVGALAAGLALGEAVAGAAGAGTIGSRWVGVGLIVASGLFGLLALGHQPAAAFLFVALIGLIDGSTDTLFDVAIQRNTDSTYLGGVFGFASAAMSTTMVIAFSVTPLLLTLMQTRGVIVVAGAFFVAGGVAATAAVTVRRGAVEAADAPHAESALAD